MPFALLDVCVLNQVLDGDSIDRDLSSLKAIDVRQKYPDTCASLKNCHRIPLYCVVFLIKSEGLYPGKVLRMPGSIPCDIGAKGFTEPSR